MPVDDAIPEDDTAGAKPRRRRKPSQPALPPGDKPKVPTQITLRMSTVDAIASYLTSRPWHEADPLIRAINEDLGNQP